MCWIDVDGGVGRGSVYQSVLAAFDSQGEFVLGHDQHGNDNRTHQQACSAVIIYIDRTYASRQQESKRAAFPSVSRLFAHQRTCLARLSRREGLEALD